MQNIKSFLESIDSSINLHYLILLYLPRKLETTFPAKFLKRSNSGHLVVDTSKRLLDPLWTYPQSQSLSWEGNVTSVMEESWQDTGIWTGLRDLRNLFSCCINIYGRPNVDKAQGDIEVSFTCPFPPGVSGYNINNKNRGVKCHKRCAGEVLGEH